MVRLADALDGVFLVGDVGHHDPVGGRLALHELVQQIQPAHVGKTHVRYHDREVELLRQAERLLPGEGRLRRPLRFNGGRMGVEFAPKSLVFGDK